MNDLVKVLKISILATMLGMAGTAFASEITDLAAECDSCHGPGGASSQGDMPIIGGQSENYILESLKSFQDWGRPCVKSKYRFGDTSRPRTDMCKITAGLSNEDFADLSVYYSGQPFVPAKQAFDATQVEAGAAAQAEYCESCHEEGGKSVGGRGPRLAGQWTPYLKATLKFVPTGEHLVPHVMEKRVADFSDETINQILNFYASQQD